MHLVSQAAGAVRLSLGTVTLPILGFHDEPGSADAEESGAQLGKTPCALNRTGLQLQLDSRSHSSFFAGLLFAMPSSARTASSECSGLDDHVRPACAGAAHRALRCLRNVRSWGSCCSGILAACSGVIDVMHILAIKLETPHDIELPPQKKAKINHKEGMKAKALKPFEA